MAVQEARDVEKSEQYHDLSPKRQEIVDAWVELYHEEGEEPKNVDVAERADANESYTSQTLTEHKDIAKARVEQKDNEREEGEVKTEGDPFQGEIPSQSSGIQTIKERPNKASPQSSPPTEQTQQESVKSETDGFTYTFSADEIETIFVDEELPESLENAVKSEVVQRAFGN